MNGATRQATEAEVLLGVREELSGLLGIKIEQITSETPLGGELLGLVQDSFESLLLREALEERFGIKIPHNEAPEDTEEKKPVEGDVESLSKLILGIMSHTTPPGDASADPPFEG